MIVVTYKGLIDRYPKKIDDFSIREIRSNQEALGESIISILSVEKTDSADLIRDVKARIFSRLGPEKPVGKNYFVENLD